MKYTRQDDRRDTIPPALFVAFGIVLSSTIAGIIGNWTGSFFVFCYTVGLLVYHWLTIVAHRTLPSDVSAATWPDLHGGKVYKKYGRKNANGEIELVNAEIKELLGPGFADNGGAQMFSYIYGPALLLNEWRTIMSLAVAMLVPTHQLISLLSGR